MEANKYPVINETKKRLSVFSELPIMQEENSLFIEPKDSRGFKVILDDNKTEFTVFCDGWSYDQFVDYEIAARAFILALSSAARLLVRKKTTKILVVA